MKTSSQWRQKYHKEKQWIISFPYVKTLTSLAIWGAGGGGGGGDCFNNQTGPSWFTSNSFFVGDMLGPYIKTRGTGAPKCQQMQTSSHAVETYVQQGKTIENLFFIYGPNCKKVHVWLLEGPGGGINDQTGPILLSSYPVTHIYVHVK